MPKLDRLGHLDAGHVFASVVRCDGVDGHPAEEQVESDRVWFVLRGRFDLRSRRHRRAGDPSTALLLRSDEPHCIRHPEGCGDLCLSVGGVLAERAVERGQAVAPLSTRSYVRLRLLARRLVEGRPIEPLAVEETLCGALDRSPAPPRPASARDRALADAVAHQLALRFDERLTLSDLAKPHGVSVFVLCRAFRRARRASIHRSLQRLRVRHALATLLDTDWPLVRIAAECGFASHAHLTTLFRRELGLPPSALRPSRSRVGARWTKS